MFVDFDVLLVDLGYGSDEDYGDYDDVLVVVF